MLTEQKLAVIISKLEEHPNPDYFLEQYSITPAVVANILFLARDDIKNRTVYDLGCGTGRFAIGSALIGAKQAYGIDLDREVLEIAKENASDVETKTDYPITKICKWVASDIQRIKTKKDVVVQFPPFSKDLIFLEKALQLAKSVYSIHNHTAKKERKIRKICKNLKFSVTETKEFSYFEGKEKLILFVIKK
jgi:putative methylase